MSVASSPRRPAAPYRAGQRVRALHHHPTHGTTASQGTVVACTRRTDGRWTLQVALPDVPEQTYTLTPAGHSDYIDALPEPARPPAETQRTRRGHAFWPPSAALAAVPGLYATEHVPLADTVLHVHYFAGAADWWIAELDPATGRAYGYACLGDPAAAEWGYVDLPDLERVRGRTGLVVERDLGWTPSPAATAALPGRAS